MANLSVNLTSAGPLAPSYSDILSSLQTSFLNIFGSDAYIAPDSQDGQLLALFAAAINDSNAATIQAYNSFSPAFAQGTNLSTMVKINGIKRLSASNSSAPVLITGVAGTIINNGACLDVSGNIWNLPTNVIIPVGGSITVLATAAKTGSIVAPSGSINQIHSPTLGWQSVISTADATLGSPVETDAALRLRQSISTSYPAVAVVNSIAAAVANVPGVLQSVIYENPTNTTDSNGLPAHSISCVVSGGDPIAVATAIAQKKTPGTGTYGTTTEIINVGGTNLTINFYEATNVSLTATIHITPKAGYNSLIGTAIQNSLVAFIGQQRIGQTIEFAEVLAACVGPTYKLESIVLTIGSTNYTNQDVPIAFNALPSLLLTNVTLSTS